MTKLEADQIAAAMKKEGWTDVRVEPSVGDGYVVAYRRLPDESFRYARQLSPAARAKLFPAPSQRQR